MPRKALNQGFPVPGSKQFAFKRVKGGMPFFPLVPGVCVLAFLRLRDYFVHPRFDAEKFFRFGTAGLGAEKFQAGKKAVYVAPRPREFRKKVLKKSKELPFAARQRVKENSSNSVSCIFAINTIGIINTINISAENTITTKSYRVLIIGGGGG
jgi:hypothetical protein